MPGLPLFFNPDPEIPDADLLGFGDLINDDGTSTYLAGEPELMEGLAPQPMGPPTAHGGMPGMGMGMPSTAGLVTSDQTPPIVTANDGRQYIAKPDGNFEPLGAGNATGLQDPNTGELLSPGEPSNILPALGGEIANAAQGYPQPLGDAWQQQMGGASGGMPSTAGLVNPDPTPPIVQGADGTQYTPNIQTGQFEPVGAGGAGAAAGDGMVPVQREGALPPGMVQQQAQQMGAQNQALLGATQQARSDEVRLYNELVLKQMAANEVERTNRERDIAEEQAKVQRWQSEQQALIDSDIETDLIAARGPVGGAMAAIGAALMGAAGNDTGFRMIERSIDQSVRLQVARRDTKLGILAQQIGSSRQAIAMGKAALYKVAADKTELLAKQTKSSVYEAQTPMVTEQLRSKQLEEMQKAEKESIGKTLEKAPVPKPPSAELLQKYGELRRERDASTGLVQRVEQQLGLLWTPGKNGQPGSYANKAEVLDRGIQGVGNLEQWIPDAVYSTLGGLTQEGRQVRGAAEALAYAQIRQMQPTGPISNADIEAAVKAGALETEDGLLRALERMRTGEEQQAFNDSAQFGPDVVQTYDARRSAAGAPQQRAPAASRPASAADIRREMEVRKPSAQQPQSTSAAMPDEPQERLAMLSADLQTLGSEAGIPPEGIAILMAQAGHETNDGKNMPGFNYFGMKSSARNRARGADSANLETTEGEGNSAQRVRQNFAVFPSSTAAAADMISLLGRKYPRALEALQMGDVDAYAAALKDGGFYTGNETNYLQGLLRRL